MTEFTYHDIREALESLRSIAASLEAALPLLEKIANPPKIAASSIPRIPEAAE